MALRDTINSIVVNKIIPEIADNFYEAHPLFWTLHKHNRVAESNFNIQMPILKDKTGGFGAYDGLENIQPVGAGDPVTDLDYQLAHFQSSFVIPFTDVLKTANPQAIRNRLEIEKENVQLTMYDGLNDQLWTDQDSTAKQMVGIPRIVAAGSSALGGVTSTNYSKWVAYRRSCVVANTLGEKDILDATIGATFGTDRPDVAFANRNTYRKVISLFTGLRKFEQNADAYLGFEHIYLNGIECFMDPKVPSSGDGATTNQLIFLNTRWLRLFFHPKDWFVARPITEDNWLAQRLAGAQFFVSLQLATNSRRSHATIYDINPAL